MAYVPQNPNGQTTMAESTPVVLASDQSNILITLDKTKYTQTTGNNTAVQLAAGATFTGAIESALNYPNIIPSVRCDQPFTLTIKQYSDAAGLIAYPDIVYTRAANVGYNDTITLAGTFVRVTLQNTGASATTNLFLETFLGILPVAQNSTNLGNAPVSLNEVGGTALTLGTKAAASSLPVTLSSENIQDLSFTGQAAQTALVNNIIPAAVSATATDLTGYRSASVQIICPTGTYTTGQIIFEGSNDNSNFVTIPVWNQLLLTGAPITAAITLVTTTFIVYTFPLTTRYVRVRISQAVSGASASVQAVSKFSQTSWTNTVTQIAQSTAANLNATVSATNLSTNIAQIGGTTTVNGGVAGMLSVGGNIAHSAASTSNPVQMGGRVVPTTIATTDTTMIAGDISYKPITTGLQAITKNFSTSELDYLVNATFNLTTATGATPSTLVSASGTASVRNYITQITVQGDALGAAGTIGILDYAIAGTSVTIATPGVFTTPAHGFIVGDAIMFSSIGTITGITINTIYYITSTSFTTTTFTIATTTNGTAIQITGVTSAFTVYKVMTQIRLQTAAIATPYVIDFLNPLRGSSNIGTLIAYPSLTSGSIYLTVNGYRGF